MRNAKGWCVLIVGVWFSGSFSGLAWSQSTVTPDQEYQQLIKVNQDIEPLGANPFGEKISTYNGELSFDETDVSLAGNGPALVVARSLSTASSISYALNAERPFGDWDLNIPRIETATVAKIQGGNTGWITNSDTIGTRCSNFGVPASPSPIQGGNPWSSDQWWYGYHLIVPGVGSQDLMLRGTANPLAPIAGTATYGIVTKQNWMISCTASNAADDGGQGFIALAPDGTQYTFTHLVYRPMATMTEPLGTSPELAKAAISGGVRPLDATSNLLERNDAFMYVTQVVDRFGNSLTYSYNNANGNLTGITASDGRSVTVNYDSTGYLITSITANASNVASRTWIYTYDTTTNSALPALKIVQLPDDTPSSPSRWTYNLSAFQTDAPDTEGGDCTANSLPTVGGTATGTITHPSGLSATFTLQGMLHGRSYAPIGCWGPTGSSDLPYYLYPEYYVLPTITSKVFTGAGLPTQTWTYSYSSPNQSRTSDACNAGGTCPSSVYTDVLDPNGNDVRYTYSNRYDATEGQLLSTTYYSGAAGGTVLKTETNTYANPTGGPWPTQYGTDLQGRNNYLQTQELAPLQMRQIQEEGDTYTWQATYNSYAQPTNVTRSNSISGQQAIQETTTFLNDPTLWVLGLTQTVVNNTTNETELSNTYNSSDLLQSRTRFGEFLTSYTYNSAGQLASFTDGNNHTTSLSNYYRGIPQSLSYPDGTSESFVVDDLGEISSITDQAGYITQYYYDLIGRVSLVVYPKVNGSVVWNAKYINYNFVNAAEHGIAAGHWDRSTSVGDDVTKTYFDAFLRPVLSDTYIAGTPNSDITTATGYDWTGAVTFASYAVNGIPDIGSITTGTHHTYDALERVTQTQEDSELGSLTTTIGYLGGAGRQVTDPKNNVTATYYQVFDEPSYKNPIQVNAPAGVSQSITRDIYGNPTAITQSGAYGSENDSVTKTLLYDGYHRLCRTTEPESGSTVMTYDAANNLAWSARGQNINDGSCGQSDVATSAQTARTYDPMNRVLTITPPAGTQTSTYTYDPRGNVATVTSGIASQSFTYNSRNMLASEALSVPGYAWALAYSYDLDAHPSAIGYPPYNGTSEGVAYNPDQLGRATQVGSYVSSITYYPNNQVAGFNYGNGASYVAQQNGRQLLSNFSYNVGSTLNLSEGLTYDANGNITAVNDQLNGARTKAFTYDALNRLTNATANGLYGTETYTYDALNNLRSRLTGGDTLTLNYSASNQLASVSEGANTISVYGYDTQGNRNSLSSSGTTTNYSFDAENQLSQVSGVEGYAYDAAGRRIAKTSASGAISEYYFYDQAGQLMYSFNPLTAFGTNYIYLGTKLIGKHIMPQLANPSAVSLSSYVNTGAFTVSWTAVTGATSYNVSNGTQTTAVNGSATTSLSVTGLAAGQYVYQVQACNGGVCGPWTSAPSLQVLPAIPVITVPSGIFNGTYIVSWTASAGQSVVYTLQQSYNGGAWNTVTSTLATSYSLPGTTSGSYTYRVEAALNGGNSAGWSATSNAVTVNTNYGVTPTPLPTLSVPATNNTGTQVISWTASSPVTTYTLQQNGFSGNPVWVTVYSGPNLSTALSNLANGTYEFQVEACNSTGGVTDCTTWASAGSMVVTLPPTSAPTLSTPTGPINFSPYTVSWTSVATATTYNLQEQINGGSWGTIQATSAVSWSASGQGDGTYAYRVQACNGNQCGPWSSTGTLTVDYPPSSAASLSGGGTNTNGSYSLSWSGVANATSYQLWQTSNGGASWTVPQSSGATSWSVSGQPSGTYIYQVEACDAGGCGPWSNQVTETVVLAPATPTISASVTEQGSTGKFTVHASWSSVANATSYNLDMKQGTGAASKVYTGSATTFSQLFTSPADLQFQVQACDSTGCSAWSNWAGADVP